MSKVLIVEEKEDVLLDIEDKLTAQGYSVVSTTSGVKGHRMVTDENPQVVIVHTAREGMDSFNVCRLIKFDDRFKDVGVIILSDREDAQAEEQIAKEVRADEYVHVPCEARILEDKVKKLMLRFKPPQEVV